MSQQSSQGGGASAAKALPPAKRARYSKNTRSYKKPTTAYTKKIKHSIFPPGTVRLRDGVMPSSLIVPFSYFDSKTLVLTTGAINFNTYRGNSLYDPDYTSTGNQPYNFDQIMPFYTTYAIYGCQVQVTFSTSADAVPIICVVRASNESTNPTNATFSAEKMKGDYGILSGKTGVVTINKYFETGRVYGITKEQVITDSSFQGTITQNPPSVMYIKCMAQPLDGTSSANVYMTVKLKMYAYLRQRLEQLQS